MNTCDQCTHYTASSRPTTFVKVANYEIAGPATYLFAGACALITDGNDIPCPKDGAVGWDYEGYIAGVYVGPKFGCIHWSKK